MIRSIRENTHELIFLFCAAAQTRLHEDTRKRGLPGKRQTGNRQTGNRQNGKRQTGERQEAVTGKRSSAAVLAGQRRVSGTEEKGKKCKNKKEKKK